MKIVSDDCVVVLIDGESRTIKFTIGIDSYIMASMSMYIKEMLEESSKEEAEAAVVEGLSEAIESMDGEEILSAMSELLQKKLVASADVISRIGESVRGYNNQLADICAFLLTKRDKHGKVEELVTADEILFNAKYSSPETRSELQELFLFAQKRFNKLVEDVVAQGKAESPQNEK